MFELGVGIFVAIAVILIIYFILQPQPQGPFECTICGNNFKRYRYQWTIDGTEHWLCPDCNQRLKRRQSKREMDAFLANPPLAPPVDDYSEP